MISNIEHFPNMSKKKVIEYMGSCFCFSLIGLLLFTCLVVCYYIGGRQIVVRINILKLGKKIGVSNSYSA